MDNHDGASGSQVRATKENEEEDTQEKEEEGTQGKEEETLEESATSVSSQNASDGQTRQERGGRDVVAPLDVTVSSSRSCLEGVSQAR